MSSRWAIVATIGSTQALAWASSFYLPAVLAVPIARDLGLTPAWVYAALSFGLGSLLFWGRSPDGSSTSAVGVSPSKAMPGLWLLTSSFLARHEPE